MIIRPAMFSDIPEMIQVKESLAFRAHSEISSEGGFLGADEHGYKAENLLLDMYGYWMLKGQRILYLLPDQALRMSELWQREPTLNGR